MYHQYHVITRNVFTRSFFTLFGQTIKQNVTRPPTNRLLTWNITLLCDTEIFFFIFFFSVATIHFRTFSPYWINVLILCLPHVCQLVGSTNWGWGGQWQGERECSARTRWENVIDVGFIAASSSVLLSNGDSAQPAVTFASQTNIVWFRAQIVVLEFKSRV